MYRAFTFSGAAFQRLPLRSLLAVSCSFYPGGAETPPVWALPRSLATTCGITVVFSSCGYLDVSVPRVRLPLGMTGRLPAGLPHSDIAGSRAICASPALFAAYHVLLRLREPRHPPSALLRFSSSWHFRAGADAAMRNNTTSETQRESAHGAHMSVKDGDASSHAAGRQPYSGLCGHTGMIHSNNLYYQLNSKYNLS